MNPIARVSISLSLLTFTASSNSHDALYLSATVDSDGRTMPIARNKKQHKKLYAEGKPNLYATGDPIELWTNSLTSMTEPYSLEYYRFPFCPPRNLDNFRVEDLYFGDFLAGDRIVTSPYQIEMGIDKSCEPLCVSFLGFYQETTRDPNKVGRAIQKGYNHQWILDGLVSASIAEDDSTITTRYWGGFPMGFVGADTGIAYINNHVNIEIHYRHSEESPDKFEIVRFTVEPFSIKHDYEHSEKMDSPGEAIIEPKGPTLSCTPGDYDMIHHTDYEQVTANGVERQEASGTMLFTYDVIWVKNEDVDWSHRWDIYLTNDDYDLAYFTSVVTTYILGSMGFSFLLAFLIAIKVHRLLKRPRYQALASTTDQANNSSTGSEIGIQALHGEVFRAPSSAPRLLVWCCGSGVHLWMTALIMTAVLAKVKFNPEHFRATMIRIGLVSFSLGGFVNAVSTAWAMRAFFGDPAQMNRSVCFAPMLFPLLVFGYYDLLNALAGMHGGSSVNFVPLHLTALLWFGVSTPIAFLGSYIGYHYPSGYKIPSACGSRRPIPKQPMYKRLNCITVLGGLPPFLSSVVSFSVFMNSIYNGIYDLNTGWNLVNLISTSILCSLTCILFMLVHFANENHQWWWRAFLTGGSPAFYYFLYCIAYEDMKGIYAGLCFFLACSFIFLTTGVASVLACLGFNIIVFQKLPRGGNQEDDDNVGYMMISDPSTD